MNPPFENAADIKHIRHPLRFLKQGGILVAPLCQRPPVVEQFGGTWEELPAYTFKEQGTAVRTVLMALTTEQPADTDPETALRRLWDE